jgi:hypothetical protein
MLIGMSTNNTPFDLPEEALAIAADAAAAQGQPVRQWLMHAISEQSARERPVVEIPVDDSGFFSEIHRPIAV